MGKVAALHLQHGEARGVAAEVDSGNDAPRGGIDRYGEGAEADLVLLIDEGVAVAADITKGKAKLVDGVDGAGGVLGEDDAGEEGF